MTTDNAVQARGEPQYLRRAQPLNQALPATWRWLAGLPPEIRPVSLLDQFPRVANLVARASFDAQDFAMCMDSLLHDRRGGRRGFPSNLHSELLVLRDFFEGRYPSTPNVPGANAEPAAL